MLQVYKVEDFSYELGDGSFRQGSHSEDMLMVFLPKEKILFNADLYIPPAQGAPTPQPTAATKTLRQMIVKEKLDVAQHVPTHGRVATNDEFVTIFATVGRTN
jgi:flavorubredoxin